MKCPICGTEMWGDMVCPNCGYSLDKDIDSDSENIFIDEVDEDDDDDEE